MKNSNVKTKRFIVKRISRPSGVVHEHITTVDAEDAHYLRNSYWFVQIHTDKNGKRKAYIVRKQSKGQHEHLHCMLVGAEPGETVWHINGDTLDNRKSNLLRRNDRVQELD